MPQQRLNPLQIAVFSLGLYAVQTFWGFTLSTLPLYLIKITGSKTLTGLIISCTGILGLFMPAFIGTVSDRIVTPIGRRRPFIIAGWITVVVFLFMLSGIESVYTAIPLIMVMYAGFFTAIGPYFALLPDITPLRQRGAVSGAMFCSGGIGILVYLFFAAKKWDTNPDLSFVWAALSVMLAIGLLTIFVREPDGRDRPSAGTGLLKELFRHSNIVLFFAGMLLWWTGLWMVSSFLVIGLKGLYGVTTERAVFAFFVFILSYIVSSLPAGLLGARIGEKRLTAAGLFILGCGILCTRYIPSFTGALAVLCVAGVGYAITLGVAYSFFMKLIPAGRTAGFVGLYMACQNGALLTGPVIGGMLIDSFGYGSLYTGSGIFIFAGLGILLLVREPGPSRV